MNKKQVFLLTLLISSFSLFAKTYSNTSTEFGSNDLYSGGSYYGGGHYTKKIGCGQADDLTGDERITNFEDVNSKIKSSHNIGRSCGYQLIVSTSKNNTTDITNLGIGRHSETSSILQTKKFCSDFIDKFLGQKCSNDYQNFQETMKSRARIIERSKEDKDLRYKKRVHDLLKEGINITKVQERLLAKRVTSIDKGFEARCSEKPARELIDLEKGCNGKMPKKLKDVLSGNEAAEIIKKARDSRTKNKVFRSQMAAAYGKNGFVVNHELRKLSLELIKEDLKRKDFSSSNGSAIKKIYEEKIKKLLKERNVSCKGECFKIFVRKAAKRGRFAFHLYNGFVKEDEVSAYIVEKQIKNEDSFKMLKKLIGKNPETREKELNRIKMDLLNIAKDVRKKQKSTHDLEGFQDDIIGYQVKKAMTLSAIGCNSIKKKMKKLCNEEAEVLSYEDGKKEVVKIVKKSNENQGGSDVPGTILGCSAIVTDNPSTDITSCLRYKTLLGDELIGNHCVYLLAERKNFLAEASAAARGITGKVDMANGLRNLSDRDKKCAKKKSCREERAREMFGKMRDEDPESYRTAIASNSEIKRVVSDLGISDLSNPYMGDSIRSSNNSIQTPLESRSSNPSSSSNYNTYRETRDDYNRNNFNLPNQNNVFSSNEQFENPAVSKKTMDEIGQLNQENPELMLLRNKVAESEKMIRELQKKLEVDFRNGSLKKPSTDGAMSEELKNKLAEIESAKEKLKNLTKQYTEKAAVKKLITNRAKTEQAVGSFNNAPVRTPLKNDSPSTTSFNNNSFSAPSTALSPLGVGGFSGSNRSLSSVGASTFPRREVSLEASRASGSITSGEAADYPEMKESSSFNELREAIEKSPFKRVKVTYQGVPSVAVLSNNGEIQYVPIVKDHKVSADLRLAKAVTQKVRARRNAMRVKSLDLLLDKVKKKN